jgi:hypothetical protein
MSRILRRPMFRGGGTVDSYGKGITAPLVPGYQGGGQIGGGIVYGKPMADGRFGFEKPIIPNFTMPNNILTNVEKSLGTGTGITTGADLLRQANQKLRSDNAYTIPPGVAMKETETTTDSDEGSKTIDTTGTDQIGIFTEDNDLLTSIDSEGNYTFNEGPSVETKNFFEGLLEPGVYVGDELKEKRKKEALEGVDRTSGNDLPPSLRNQLDFDPKTELKKETELEEGTQISAKDAIAENQALFAELLGSDKARGQDIGDMLLRFSGSGGNTIGEKFQNYVRAESAAGPSRSEKIKQTAAGLAINDYVAGKRSKEQIEALKGKIDYEYGKKAGLASIQESDDVSTALAKMSKLTDSSFDSLKNIKALINKKTGRSDIFQGTIKIDDLKNQRKLNKLKPGYNIIEDEGIKRIVEVGKQGDNNVVISIQTISELWTG